MSSTEVFFLALFLGLLYLLWQISQHMLKAPPKLTKLDLPRSQPSDHATSKPPVKPDLALPYTLASALNDYYQNSAHPEAAVFSDFIG